MAYRLSIFFISLNFSVSCQSLYKKKMMKNWVLMVFLLAFTSSCSLWERKQFEYAYEEINENEILVDFTKINSGNWDTLLFISPYATSEQIGLGYMDSQFLAQRAVNDGVINSGFLENGELNGYSSCTRLPVDFDQVLGDSVFVKKFPRSEAVFRFAKQEDGTYRLKK
jgi:hypothetical protein